MSYSSLEIVDEKYATILYCNCIYFHECRIVEYNVLLHCSYMVNFGQISFTTMSSASSIKHRPFSDKSIDHFIALVLSLLLEEHHSFGYRALVQGVHAPESSYNGAHCMSCSGVVASEGPKENVHCAVHSNIKIQNSQNQNSLSQNQLEY